MDNTMNMQLLTAAHEAWSAASGMRESRRRFKRYTYGDQWGDTVTDSTGKLWREGDLVAQTGREPLTNNLIRRLVKTIVGRFRNTATEAKRYSGSGTPPYLAELDARLLEEFLISGRAIQRVTAEGAGGTPRFDNVNPEVFFTNGFRDPCCRDIEMAGMLHDMSMPELLARFGNGERRRIDRIRGLYSGYDDVAVSLAGDSADFFTARDGKCRVIELWTLEAVETTRGRNVRFDFGWRCRWLTPRGDQLATYQSPWKHGGHPFALKYYPLTDGEVHPFVEDVLDQQRYINRLIVLIDKMMGASAKGVLLFPVDQKVAGVSWEDIRRHWSAADGVIPIQGRAQILPQQISGNGQDAGAHKLLELELKLFEDVSGVSDALLGKAAGGNGGSALYESQVANSRIALADIYDTFDSLLSTRDYLAKNL